MLLLWLTAEVIVHESCDKELELLDNLIDCARVGSFVDLIFQNIVHLDDLLICVSEIVFTPISTRHCNTWSDWRWCDWQVLKDHPFWSALLEVEAHER